MMSKSTRIFSYILGISQKYNNKSSIFNQFTYYSSSKEIGFIKLPVSNADFLLQKLKSASSPKTVLELVSDHHKIMNNKHLMQALRSLFSLQKSGHSDLLPNEIMNHSDFKTLCLSLKSQIRSIELKDTIEALKVVSYVGIPSNSTIMQVLLQLIRHNVNQLSLQQIIFLDFLLKQFESTPLSDALLIALPIVFEINLPLKMDRDNISHLSDLLQFISKRQVSDETVNLLVNTIQSHRHFSSKEASSIVWSLCDLRPNEISALLLKKALKIVIKNEQEIKMSDLETILTKLILRYNIHQPYYYNEEFFDLVGNRIIEKDLGFQQALWIIQKYCKVGHCHQGLLDYSAKNEDLIENATYQNLLILVTGFAATEYKPRNWESVRKSILCNKNLSTIKHDFHWLKFCAKIATLNIFIPSILDKVFNEDSLKKLLNNSSYENLRYFLSLYQVISTLQPDYKSYLPTNDCVNQIFDRYFHMNIQDYPLQGALEKALGGKQYILTKVTTKMGHDLQHAIIMRKGGYPVAFTHMDRKVPIVLEELEIPIDSQIVIILSLSSSFYTLNGQKLQGMPSLAIRTLEASGYSVVVIPMHRWGSLSDHEKIPFLMREIREKNNETEMLSTEQII